MKLVRCGERGREKPGVLLADRRIKDRSALVTADEGLGRQRYACASA